MPFDRRWALRCAIPLGVTLAAGCATAPSPSPSPPVPADSAARDLVLDRAEFLSERQTAEFTATQREQIRLALARADSAVSDPRFGDILEMMESARQISWSFGRGGLLPREASGNRTAWLVARFRKNGNFRADQLHARDLDEPNTVTTAWTSPCVDDTPDCPGSDLNPGFLDKWAREGDTFALTNTVVHERVHSFGQRHSWLSQTTGANKCDLAYVAGDLAEVLMRSRAAGGAIPDDTSLCRALRRQLANRGLTR